MPKSVMQRVAVLVEQDVVGLDVAMHHAAPVRVVERDGHLRRGGGRRVRAPPARSRCTRSASEPPARYGITMYTVSPACAEVEHGTDVRMHEPRGRLGLAPEALGHLAVAREMRVQHLHHDLALERHLLGAEDGRHAAAAEPRAGCDSASP